jgi:hypothetical protein
MNFKKVKPQSNTDYFLFGLYSGTVLGIVGAILALLN